MSSHENKRRRTVYEGKVYVRPIGRGIVLEDEPGEPHIDDWLEAQLTRLVPGASTFGNFSTRVRITVEHADPEGPKTV